MAINSTVLYSTLLYIFTQHLHFTLKKEVTRPCEQLMKNDFFKEQSALELDENGFLKINVWLVDLKLGYLRANI